MVKKYYAVVSGKKPGIYTDFETTKNMVDGFSGAIYKVFPTKSKAEAFISNSKFITKEELIKYDFQNNIQRTVIYTDGSFEGKDAGFGVVIVENDGHKITAHGHVPDTLHQTNITGELYAIYVALSLIRDNVIIYTDSQNSINCLTIGIHNLIKYGFCNLENKTIIQAIYLLINDRDVRFFYVKAHDGNELNIEADRLANIGRLGTDTLIILN